MNDVVLFFPFIKKKKSQIPSINIELYFVIELN